MPPELVESIATRRRRGGARARRGREAQRQASSPSVGWSRSSPASGGVGEASRRAAPGRRDDRWGPYSACEGRACRRLTGERQCEGVAARRDQVSTDRPRPPRDGSAGSRAGREVAAPLSSATSDVVGAVGDPCTMLGPEAEATLASATGPPARERIRPPRSGIGAASRSPAASTPPPSRVGTAYPLPSDGAAETARASPNSWPPHRGRPGQTAFGGDQCGHGSFAAVERAPGPCVATSVSLSLAATRGPRRPGGAGRPKGRREAVVQACAELVGEAERPRCPDLDEQGLRRPRSRYVATSSSDRPSSPGALPVDPADDGGGSARVVASPGGKALATARAERGVGSRAWPLFVELPGGHERRVSSSRAAGAPVRSCTAAATRACLPSARSCTHGPPPGVEPPRWFVDHPRREVGEFSTTGQGPTSFAFGRQTSRGPRAPPRCRGSRRGAVSQWSVVERPRLHPPCPAAATRRRLGDALSLELRLGDAGRAVPEAGGEGAHGRVSPGRPPRRVAAPSRQSSHDVLSRHGDGVATPSGSHRPSDWPSAARDRLALRSSWSCRHRAPRDGSTTRSPLRAAHAARSEASSPPRPTYRAVATSGRVAAAVRGRRCGPPALAVFRSHRTWWPVNSAKPSARRVRLGRTGLVRGSTSARTTPTRGPHTGLVGRAEARPG